MKPGKCSQFTEEEINEIRAAHTERREALRRIKELQAKYDLNTQRFSQIALGQVDGRKPREAV